MQQLAPAEAPYAPTERIVITTCNNVVHSWVLIFCRFHTRESKQKDPKDERDETRGP